jgi:hypothetical protein
MQLKPARSWRPRLEEDASSNRSRADQSWHRSGVSCPQGTVPIRRAPDESAVVDTAVADGALRRSFSTGGEGGQVVHQDGAAAAGPRIEVGGCVSRSTNRIDRSRGASLM